MKTAVFPGSFDPFTVGHESIVRRSIDLFDKIIIAIGYNSAKSGYFSLEKREQWIKDIFIDQPKVTVDLYEGLTIDYCRKNDIHFILRGLRTAADFEYERAIAQMNKMLFSDLETVFILTMPEHSMISSTIVREVIRHGGDASRFIPKAINLLDL